MFGWFHMELHGILWHVEFIGFCVIWKILMFGWVHVKLNEILMIFCFFLFFFCDLENVDDCLISFEIKWFFWKVELIGFCAIWNMLMLSWFYVKLNEILRDWELIVFCLRDLENLDVWFHAKLIDILWFVELIGFCVIWKILVFRWFRLKSHNILWVLWIYWFLRDLENVDVCLISREIKWSFMKFGISWFLRDLENVDVCLLDFNN